MSSERQELWICNHLLSPPRQVPEVDITPILLTEEAGLKAGRSTPQVLSQAGGRTAGVSSLWQFLPISWCCPDPPLPSPSLSQAGPVCEGQRGEAGPPTGGMGLHSRWVSWPSRLVTFTLLGGAPSLSYHLSSNWPSDLGSGKFLRRVQSC